MTVVNDSNDLEMGFRVVSYLHTALMYDHIMNTGQSLVIM